MAQPPVPGLDDWKAAVLFWQKAAHDKWATGAVGAFSATTAIQYDGTLGRYVAKDFSPTPADWDPRITRAWQEYNHYLTVRCVPPGAIAAHLLHIDGLLEDHKRGVVRNPTARTSVNSILNNGTNALFLVHDGGADMTKQEYSREVAYCLYLLLLAPLFGITLTPAQVARRDVMFTRALGHLDAWTNNTGSYCRPFMMAITAKSLIKYHELIADAAAKANIVAKLEAASDYAWNTCFKATAGTWGPAGSMTYTDRFVVDADDQRTMPDLNAVIAPMYAWLWAQTGKQKFRDRHDVLFFNGIPRYNGTTHLSGAWCGTPTNPAIKQIHQQTFWAADGLKWAAVEPATDIKCTLCGRKVCGG
jgi:hypothetical protein